VRAPIASSANDLSIEASKAPTTCWSW
jgi:hypothetical protein